MIKPVIVWFRRDLRLADNLALHSACTGDSPVIPLFVLDAAILNSSRSSPARMAFLFNALRSLNASLERYQTRLVIRSGDPLEVIPALIREVEAQALYLNADYTPYARQRDEMLRAAVDVAIHVSDDALLIPPGAVMKDDGDPYVVYSPFKRRWNELNKPAVSMVNFHAALFVEHDALPDGDITIIHERSTNSVTLPEASEAAANSWLNQFLAADITRYKDVRNTLIINPYGPERPNGTSYLSPYLRMGLISPRVAYQAARDAYTNTQSRVYRESIETWVSELTWREFYMHILYHFPHVLSRDFVDTYLDLEWRNAPDDLQAWQDGMTGYPIVDAAMRQLRAIGWMPNRARMVVASFLTKDLLIHWGAGEQYFMQHLIDGDPAANNGGWQWAAGTGTDAQPYFRIFNPVSQSRKFAPAEYLRHWLPELADVPDEYIHTPWEMTTPPDDYPPPIVDHAQARERTTQAFKTARGDKD